MNDNHEKNKKKTSENMKIQQEDRINVEYDKEKLYSKFPHLMSEVSNKKQSIKIESITNEIEKVGNEIIPIKDTNLPNELINPGAIDFLRRCTTNEEAFEIIDYLLQRKELTQQEYDEFHDQIVQEGGLKKLIEESGGFKKEGYYERKYYKKK